MKVGKDGVPEMNLEVAYESLTSENQASWAVGWPWPVCPRPKKDIISLVKRFSEDGNQDEKGKSAS